MVAVIGEVLAEILKFHEIKGYLRQRLESRIGIVAGLNLRLVGQSYLVLMLRRIELLVRGSIIKTSIITVQ